MLLREKDKKYPAIHQFTYFHGSINNYLKAINKALMNVARLVIVKGIIFHCPLCSKIIFLL